MTETDVANPPDEVPAEGTGGAAAGARTDRVRRWTVIATIVIVAARSRLNAVAGRRG